MEEEEEVRLKGWGRAWTTTRRKLGSVVGEKLNYWESAQTRCALMCVLIVPWGN